MKITPSSRILKMLGEIEFDEWQCIAELVDNAFDDFTEIRKSGVPWAGGFKVSVSLPSLGAKSHEAKVVIQDTGRGMSYEELELAVRAGWSNNDRFDKLGLFGMGFNVSTARLGRRTRVLTTRAGDPHWIGVEIDLDRIKDDFEAEDIIEPKADPNEHGTKIEISRLHAERADWLRRNAANLRTTLGRTYSYILENKGYELWVGGQKVKPRRHCRWGDDRYVIYGSGASSEKIPAYIEIDERFEPAEACADCGNWQVPNKGKCEQCDGERLTLRERRIHGWLGIQRHLHKREYGIDFLRNGRKILQWDKRLFEWSNPNDPQGLVDIEYPVEMAHQGGRIIGEIHLDHVPVTYQKNAFEYGDRSWRAAVDYLRGPGPLQPDKAKRLGYLENPSPLAKLFKGYRRNDAGRRCLVPGDGTRPIHDTTRRWADLFHRGDAEYQSDQLWWDAVVAHDAQGKKAKLDIAQNNSPIQADEAAVLDALGVTPNGAQPPASKPEDGDVSGSRDGNPPATEKETTQDRLARYRADSRPMPELSRDFGSPRVGFLHVETKLLETGLLVDDQGSPTPVLVVQGAGGKATAFIDGNHEIFAKLGVEPVDLLLVELATILKVKAETGLTHAQLVADLRAGCLPDHALKADVVAGQARELLTDLRVRMASRVDVDPARAYQYLSPDELTATENEMIANGQVGLTGKLGETSEFLLYAPPLFTVKLLESWPEAFMDGNVFVGPYASVSSMSARRLSLAKVVGYLTDIATLVSFNAADPGPQQLLRTRLSIKLLSDEIASET
ncbi:ATP-binding protein [Sphaerisporangium sp. NPDC049003]|uniref:ATP-binding protein n=1 Tax=Sphaerisporangium sp. NPDC049003 TaxID=3364517 RepID=UPI0037218BA4